MPEIKDAGEELAYNRRNRDKALKWDDIKNLDAALRASSVTKERVWPKPKYEELISNGMHPMQARMLKLAYDALAAKPPKVDDESLEHYIQAMSRVRDTMTDWASDRKNLLAYIESEAAQLKSVLGVENTERQAMAGYRVNILDLIPKPRTGPKHNFLTVLWPEEMAKERSRFRLGSPATAEVGILGGNRMLSKLQPGVADISKMLREVNEGWPAKKAAWQVQGFQILSRADLKVEIDNSPKAGWFVFAEGPKMILASRLNTQAEAQAVADGVAEWTLINKNKSIIHQGKTREECVAAAEAATSRSRTTWSPDTSKQEYTRQGPDLRKGQDITPEKLLETFGFRGVNYGNWVPDAERQKLTNAAFEAFADMSDVLGIPPAGIGQYGMLGMAIGAQGSGGKFAGHFVPGLNEINETRFSGGGVIAHEWGHFVDHLCAVTVMGDDAREENAYLSRAVVKQGVAALCRKYPQHDALIHAMGQLWDQMSKRPQTQDEALAKLQARVEKCRKNVQGWWAQVMRSAASASTPLDKLKELTAPLEKTLEDLKQRGVRGDNYAQLPGTRTVKYAVLQEIADLAERFEQLTGKRADKEAMSGLFSNLHSIGNCQPGGTYYEQTLASQPPVPTTYLTQSMLMDKSKGGEAYWSTPHEMFARAYSDWVRHKIESTGRINTHLSQDCHTLYSLAVEQGLVEANPYLSPDELMPVVARFDALLPLLPIHADRSAEHEQQWHEQSNTEAA